MCTVKHHCLCLQLRNDSRRELYSSEAFMHRLFGTCFLVVAAAFCLVTAWSSGFSPQQFAHRLGLTVTGPDGYNEIRAQYGGFFLAAAGMCIAALASRVLRPSVFVLLSVTFGGLLAGRLASLVINGGLTGFGPTIRALYIIDAIGFALSIIAIRVDQEL
jgi:hypothetical protein